MLSFTPPYNQVPRTPSSSSTYHPHTSSPLSEPFSPSPSTSATAKKQSRRLAQYKSTTPIRRPSKAYSSRPKDATPDESNFGIRLFAATSPGDAENPRSALLRDRLKQRCALRAQQARTKRVANERRAYSLSSDGEGMDVESDEEEEEDAVLNDELFRRIIASASQKHRYSYRLSYQNDVGSSLDPDMEDITEWERNLQDDDTPAPVDDFELPPSEFDEDDIAELAAQAEEAEYWANLEAHADDIFSLSDLEDLDARSQGSVDEDVEMS
ncbi:hypothetical protein BC834DRAFT_246150 [Gloeopeniophorella convolvens]|nr:hypothetical protein BC834DRAFT_246150 [Gloeopeniophorella convolvens]